MELAFNKRTIINVISGLVSFAINMAINFVMTPYIVSSIGVAAYGFVGLSNDIISYMSIASIALNSVAARFISIEYYRHDIQMATKYYSAVFFGNMIISFLLLIPCALLVFFVDGIMIIPANLVNDVRLLLIFLFLSLLINTIFNVWNTASFITNKMYLLSAKTIISGIIRLLTLVILFSAFPPRLFFIGFAILFMSFFSTIYDFQLKSKLIPEIHAKLDKFLYKTVFGLISSGIWNVVGTSGVILLNGLDLLIANLCTNPTDMGVLSLSKTIPILMLTLSGALPNYFAPVFTKMYAANDYSGLVAKVHQANRISSLIISVPLAGFVVFGIDFYKLWVPFENASTLYYLSLLALAPLFLSGGLQSIFNIFTVTNRLRTNAILVIISGFLSTFTVLILISKTSFGVYAIAGISSLYMIIRHLLYSLPYASKYLGEKWYAFFADITYTLFGSVITIIVGIGIKSVVTQTTWLQFFFSVLLTGFISYALCFFAILKKMERIRFKLLIFKISYHQTEGRGFS